MYYSSITTPSSTLLSPIEDGNVTWPSLYNPLVDLGHGGDGPASLRGKYLSGAGEIFTFTLYWALVLHVPLYAVLGACACANVLVPRARPGRATLAGTGTGRGGAGASVESVVRRRGTGARRGGNEETGDAVPLAVLPPHPEWPGGPGAAPTPAPAPAPSARRTRHTRLAAALLVLAVFLAAGVASAVLGAAILGFVLARVYSAAGFSMSTWVPFIWAVIHSLVGLLGTWPSVVDII